MTPCWEAPLGKAIGVTDCKQPIAPVCTHVPLRFFPKNCISSLRIAVGVFPLLCVYLMKTFSSGGTHIVEDGQEDDF